MEENHEDRISPEQIMKIQIDEIEKYKWIESEKAGRDLGNHAVCEWIATYAADFREYWERRLRELGC